MPFYEYQCSSCEHHVEVLQKISDAPLRKCPDCGKQTLKRLISAPVFRLKGGGWYETDFKSDSEQKRNLASREEAGESKAEETKAESADATKGEAKTTEAKGDSTKADTEVKKAAVAKPVAKSVSKPDAKPVKPAKAVKTVKAASRKKAARR